MLVPMLVLLPPATVPLFTAAGLVIASLARLLARRVSIDHVLFSVPNAWHTMGPVAVLMLAGPLDGGWRAAGIYLVAFLAGCVVDLVASTVREAAALAVAPRLQLRVVAIVWLIDVCTAPIGFLLAHNARHDHAALLMVLPLSALLLLLDRDRHHRLTFAFLSPAWPRNVRVGANSPSLWPTICSEMKTGTCFRPSCTAIVWPTISGKIVELRDHVRIMFFEPDWFIDSMRPSRRSSTNGPFFAERLISGDPPCRGGGSERSSCSTPCASTACACRASARPRA
jgi:hypothetical protein